MTKNRETGPVNCILDGLDECEPESLELLLSKLNQIDTESLLKVIVLSREHPMCLKHSLGHFPGIRLYPDAKEDVNNGLQLYISSRVAELARVEQYSDALAQYVEKILRERSNGTYSWVSFVIDSLRDVEVSDVEAHLDDLPQGLDAMYRRMLQQVKPQYQGFFRDILRWCTFSQRSLAPNELVAALGLKATKSLESTEVLRGKLGYCGHLVNVSETAVTLVHQSAYDFLTRPPAHGGDANAWYSLRDTEREHAELAGACLSYLQNGCLDDQNRPHRYVKQPNKFGCTLPVYAGWY
ncbi:Fc.00g081500.m01.CDS01 [Cosmosporella sp. VM-42]